MAWHNLRKSPDSIMADAFQSSVFLLIGQQGIWMRWRHFGHLPVALQTGLQDVRWIPEVLSANLTLRIVSGLPVFIGSWVSPPIKAWESKQRWVL